MHQGWVLTSLFAWNVVFMSLSTPYTRLIVCVTIGFQLGHFYPQNFDSVASSSPFRRYSWDIWCHFDFWFYIWPDFLFVCFPLWKFLRSLSLVIQNCTVINPGAIFFFPFILLETWWVLSIKKLISFRCEGFSFMISLIIYSPKFSLVILS